MTKSAEEIAVSLIGLYEENCKNSNGKESFDERELFMKRKQWIGDPRAGFITCIFVFFALLMAGCGMRDKTSPDSANENAGLQTTRTAAHSVPGGYPDQEYYGKLSISKVDYQVAVYCADASGSGESAQMITDNENSAAIFKYGLHTIIADHDYQGFDVIKEVSPGDTCTIDFPDGRSQTLQCVATAQGVNTAEMLIATDSIQGKNIAEGITGEKVNLFHITQPYTVMYTCDVSPGLFITFWREY